MFKVKCVIPFVAAFAICALAVFHVAANDAHRPDIIMITVDTLRADRLSGYGYERRTSPAIDALMNEGIRFEDALTAIPLTGPSFSSIMTSHYPHETGATRNGLPMDRTFPTLAELLKRHGYATGAIISNWTLKREISGMDRGFDYYNDDLKSKRTIAVSEQDARCVTNLAIAWINRAAKARPFFAWAHYSDTHTPYKLRKQFAFRLRKGETEDSPSYRYDTEVAYVDFHIGRLLRFLESRNLKNDALIIFLADHGESLGEHDYFGHGRQVYQPIIRVPLSITGPGIYSGIVCKAGVSLLDVMPTILSRVGISLDGLRGRNLIASGGMPVLVSEFTRFFETYHGAVPDAAAARKVMPGAKPLRIGVIEGDWKLIHSPEEDLRALYNLSADPLELDNISVNNKARTAVMTRRAWDLFQETNPKNPPKPRLIPPDVRKNLESLGYLQ